MSTGTTLENWGKTFVVKPKELVYPKSLDELVDIVRRARNQNARVRVVGTAHSWNPLIQTPDILVSLDAYQGLEAVDRQNHQVTILAGTKLKRLGDLLRAEGMAMENLGDIDEQAIAGAVSTATHGTGIQFGVIASQAIELTIVTGDGSVLTLTKEDNPDVFRAAQVALGMCGILAKIRLQCMPAYNLECIKKRESFDLCFEQIDAHVASNRNFELYWFPYSELVATKYLNITTEEPPKSGLYKYLVDVVYENGLFKTLSEACRVAPSLCKSVAQLSATAIAAGREVHHSHKVYATPRLVRFYEMEYGVPAAEGPTVLRKIKDYIKRDQVRVHFPLEYRYVKADDIYISPAYGQDTCFISCHMYLGMPYDSYFRGLEKIFLEHNGRPHWAKMHKLTAAQLRPKYPKWDEFLGIREKLDPQGVFLNDYVRSVFGI
jgi:FAD-linked oxidoreductase